MDSGHGAEALVGRESILAILAAAKQETKVLVEMGKELVLVCCGTVGRHVVHQRYGCSTVKEVDGDTLATTSV